TYLFDYTNNPNAPSAKLYKSIVDKYDPGANPLDSDIEYGFASAWTMVHALTHMSGWKNPFLYPGVTMTTTGTERFPIDQQILEQYRSGAWHPFGHIFSKAR